MPITLDGTSGVTTPGITLGSTAVTASANALNSSGEDVNAENRIINGDFRIWQRAASSSLTGYVASDRWNNGFSGGTVNQSIGAFTLGDVLGANNPKYFLRQTVSGQTLPSQYALTYQKIESVLSYAGQTITVLGWARRSSGATGNMALEAFQSFGTGGSPSGSIFGISPTTITLSTTWQPFAAVITVPSITGKALGTNDNDCLGFQFWISGGSDYNSRTNNLGLQTIGADLWGIHIRTGVWTASDTALYRPRDVGTELALCQRYYESRNATTTANGQYINAYSFMVAKRVAPTLTVIAGGLLGATWGADTDRFLQLTNGTGSSGVGFGCEAEL